MGFFTLFFEFFLGAFSKTWGTLILGCQNPFLRWKYRLPCFRDAFTTSLNAEAREWVSKYRGHDIEIWRPVGDDSISTLIIWRSVGDALNSEIDFHLPRTQYWNLTLFTGLTLSKPRKEAKCGMYTYGQGWWQGTRLVPCLIKIVLIKGVGGTCINLTEFLF